MSHAKLLTCFAAACLLGVACSEKTTQGMNKYPATTRQNTSFSSGKDEFQDLKQLHCTDLRGGDIMLKILDVNSKFNRQIGRVQQLRGYSNYNIVHAGIMEDTACIIEAEESGLEEQSLLEKNIHVSYIVYRANNPKMAEEVTREAQLLYYTHLQRKSVRYNKLGLLPSLFGRGKPKSAKKMKKIYHKIISGRNNPMFCSQFVVYLYQWIAEQLGISAKEIFDRNDSKVPPAKLAEMLENNTFFTEVGYIIRDDH